MLSQARGGCCGKASATKEDLLPAKSKQQPPDSQPGPKAVSAGSGGADPAAAGNQATNGDAPDSHGSQRDATPPEATSAAASPAATAAAPAGAAPTAAASALQAPAEAEDVVAPLDGERRVRPARPRAGMTDTVAGMPTIAGQRRAQAIAAEAGYARGALPVV